MNCIERKPERRRGRRTVAGKTRRLRPAVVALEGRTLLSTIVVDNPTDKPVTGQTDLRQAIAYAETLPGPSTITFDPAFFGTRRRTIRLTGGPLYLTDPANITIVGPGARRLTIGGGGKSGVFDLEGGSLALSGLTIANGNANLGGGLLNEGGRLVLTNVLIHGNRAIVGGGLYNDGRTTLRAVSIKGNRAHVGPGLFNARGATLLRRRPPVTLPAATRESNNLIGGDTPLAPRGNDGGPTSIMGVLPGAWSASKKRSPGASP